MNKLKTYTLNNGLRLFFYKDKRRHSTFFQFSTFCGGLSKHFKLNGKEYHLNDGVAHVLEHYIVEANNFGNFLDMLGAKQMTTNASTSMKVTSYYFETVENISFGIDTLLNGIYDVDFSEDKLLKLKNPVYQEIRGKFDNKFYHLNRMKWNDIFNNIDYRDIGGTLEEVETINIKDLEVMYNAFYQPSNQFIVVAGNFNEDEVFKQIESFYNSLKLGNYKLELLPSNELLSVNKTSDTLSFPTPMEYIEFNFKIDISKYDSNSLLDLDFYLNCFYSDYFGVVSNNYKELVERGTIIDNINCYDTKIEDYLIISIGAYVNDSNDFKNTILNSLNSLNSFKKENFELNKKNSIVRLILREENIFSTIFPLIDNIVYYDYPYMDKPEDVEKLLYENYTNSISSLDFSNFIVLQIKNK